MSTFAGSYIPAPKGAPEFEEIVADVARILWAPYNFFPYGRSGQAQDGVDVFGTIPNFGVVAYQCKNTIAGVSNDVLLEEALKAEKNPVGVNFLYIATTAPRDTHLKIYANSLHSITNPIVKFPVDIIFWDDIVSILTQDLNKFGKHYPQISLPVINRSENDNLLLEGIINLFGRSGTISFLKSHDMGNGIRGDETNYMSEFYHNWNTSDRTFKDSNLEAKRQELYFRNESFLRYISVNFSHNNGWYSAKHMRETSPEKYKEIIDTLHEMSEAVRKAYDTLVIAGR